jgi:type III restriction enzyme
MDLREVEKTKIECARKFFDTINQRVPSNQVEYDVIDSYERLMDVVGLK